MAKRSWLWDSDYRQRQDVNSLVDEVEEVHSTQHHLTMRVAALERLVEQLARTLEITLDVLDDRGLMNEADLRVRMAALGTAGAPYRAGAAAGRSVPTREHVTCAQCGATVGQDTTIVTLIGRVCADCAATDSDA